MGYGVYQDSEAYWPHRVERWAGYDIPAYCDWPACSAAIDRGLYFKCEEPYLLGADGDWIENEDAPGTYITEEGCGLFFCDDHKPLHAQHLDITPKQDTRRWLMWMATDESWEKWREQNSDAWARVQDRIGR